MIRCLNPRMIVFAAAAMAGAAFCVTAIEAGIDAKFWIALVLTAFFTALGALCARSARQRLAFLAAVLTLWATIGVSYAWSRTRYVTVTAARAAVRCVVTQAPLADRDAADFGRFVVNRLEIDGRKLPGRAELILENPDAMLLDLPLGEGLRLARAEVTTLGDAYAGRACRYRITADFTDCRYDPDYRGGAFERLRYRAINLLRDHRPESAGLAAALLFGDKSGLTDEDYQSFRLAGLAHALAVSGLHVGFLIAAINFATARCKRFRVARFVAEGLLLIGYAAVCGGAVSVVRAVIMGLLGAFAGLIGRRPEPLHHLAAAAIVILAWNPGWIRDLGFAMSFLSVLGILLAVRPLTALYAGMRLPRGIASSLAVTTAATLGILPVTAAYFHTLNLWSLLVNLVALPYVMVCFITLLLAALAAVCGLPVLLAAPDFLLRGLMRLTELAAALPGADFLLLSFGPTTIPYYLALIVFGGLVMFASGKRRLLACALSLAVLAATLTGVNLPKRYDRFHIGAVGVERSVVSVTVADGRCFVVGKIDRTVYARLDAFLAENRLRSIDLLVVAAYDGDAETVSRLIQRYRVGAVVFDYVEREPYLTDGLRCDAVLADAMIFDGTLLESALDSPDIRLSRGADSVLTENGGAGYPGFCEFVVGRRPTESAHFFRNIVTGVPAALPERTLRADKRLIGFDFG